MGSATATNAPRFEVTSLNDYIFGDYELPSSTSGPDLSRETNQPSPSFDSLAALTFDYSLSGTGFINSNDGHRSIDNIVSPLDAQWPSALPTSFTNLGVHSSIIDTGPALDVMTTSSLRMNMPPSTTLPGAVCTGNVSEIGSGRGASIGVIEKSPSQDICFDLGNNPRLAALAQSILNSPWYTEGPIGPVAGPPLETANQRLIWPGESRLRAPTGTTSVLRKDGYHLLAGPPLPRITKSTLYLKPPQIGQRKSPRLSIIDKQFTLQSARPNLLMRKLLDYVVTSDFFYENTVEPRLDTPTGQQIVDLVRKSLIHEPYYSMKESDLAFLTEIASGSCSRSIYWLFGNRKDGCLFCEFDDGSTIPCSFKGSRDPRYVDHVRTHVGHRPYICTGGSNCEVCGVEPQTFFSQKDLRQHLKRQKREHCEECGKPIRVGGMARHLQGVHKAVTASVEEGLSDDGGQHK